MARGDSVRAWREFVTPYMRQASEDFRAGRSADPERMRRNPSPMGGGDDVAEEIGTSTIGTVIGLALFTLGVGWLASRARACSGDQGQYLGGYPRR